MPLIGYEIICSFLRRLGNERVSNIAVGHLTARLAELKPKPTEKADKEVLSLPLSLLPRQSSRCGPFLSSLGLAEGAGRGSAVAPPSSTRPGAGPRLRRAGCAASTAGLAFLQAGALRRRGCVRLFGQKRGSGTRPAYGICGFWVWWEGCVVCISNGWSRRRADALSALGREQRVPEQGGEAERPQRGLSQCWKLVTATLLSLFCAVWNVNADSGQRLVG